MLVLSVHRVQPVCRSLAEEEHILSPLRCRLPRFYASEPAYIAQCRYVAEAACARYCRRRAATDVLSARTLLRIPLHTNNYIAERVTVHADNEPVTTQH